MAALLAVCWAGRWAVSWVVEWTAKTAVCSVEWMVVMSVAKLVLLKEVMSDLSTAGRWAVYSADKMVG